MSLCGDESERCSASDQPDRLRNSSHHMLRSITVSTSVAISSRPQPSVGSAPRPLTRGVPLLGLLPEPTFDCNQFDRTQQRDKPLHRRTGQSAIPGAKLAVSQPSVVEDARVSRGNTANN